MTLPDRPALSSYSNAVLDRAQRGGPATPAGEVDHPQTGDESARSFARLTPLADVAPETVSWLWPGRLPVGKLVLLDGDPSLGKSTLALTMAAHISTGKPWPDGTDCPTGDVVLMSAEDGVADTIRPRLDAAGGDPARVHALTAMSCMDSTGTVTNRLPTLADALEIGDALEQTGARLLIVDVFMAYLPGRVDSHRDQDVRGVLHRLAQIGEATGCTVLALRHLNKTSANSPLYRGGGSIGIIGAARAGYLVAPDPDDDDVRVLACTKSNLAPIPPSLAYRLESAPGTHVARVVWTGPCERSAADLLRTELDTDEHTERDEAAEWLINYLTEPRHGGAARFADILKAARADGIAERTLKRARHRAGVTSERRGFGQGAEWSYDPSRPH